MAENEKKRTWIIKIAAALAVLVVLAMVFTSILGGDKTPASADTDGDGNATVDTALIERLKQAAENPQSCKSYFNEDELTEDGNVLPALPKNSYAASVAMGKRHTGDSIDTRLVGDSDKEKFVNLAKKICSRPYVGASFGVLLRNDVKIGNQSVDSVLSDLGPAASAADIKGVVKDAYASVAGWETYQEQIAPVVAVLNVFNIEGVQKGRMSVVNYHYSGGGIPDKDGYPNVRKNPNQENLPALVLELREKGNDCPLVVIGANILDTRPELFNPNCGKEKTPPPPGKTPPPPRETPKCPPSECPPPPSDCPTPLYPGGPCPEGKNADDKPTPNGGPVKQCPGGYLGRDGKCHDGQYTPPPNNGGNNGGNQGQGDSGPGATNTVDPPPTSQPEDPLPNTGAPTEGPPPKP